MAECYPISTVPGTSALFRDFCEGAAAGSAQAESLRQWYPAAPFRMDWAAHAPSLDEAHRERLADALLVDAERFGAGEAARRNIAKLRNGAAAVVTGQQVGLFGGPLLTLLKAATALRKAQDATAASGREHVPVFWLATEDHDIAEVDQVTLPAKRAVETVKLGVRPRQPVPVGGVKLDDAGTLEAALDRVCELFGWGPAADLLRECYAPGATLATAFGSLMTRLFAEFGLVVMDASARAFHALGASVLTGAIERADELEERLLARSEELTEAGYHAQVLVTRGHSLLFLLDAATGARLPLRRSAEGGWKAGAQSFTADDLLRILADEPERLSPNALLRPVFQDAILPTAAYVGGPAEIAYFAQSAVVYEDLLGRVTPVLPRLSATLVEPAAAGVLAQHEVSLPQVWEAHTAEALALRLGARAMPIEGKRKLAAAGNALDGELSALTAYMTGLNEDLGRAAGVSASKMRYQMARLRRMAARFEVQRQASLDKHAAALVTNLFPEAHLQERVLGGIWFVARDSGSLLETLVAHAGLECPGHRVIWL